jgi:hypothetical protein
MFRLQDDLEDIQREIDILKATERAADVAAMKYSGPDQAAEFQSVRPAPPADDARN